MMKSRSQKPEARSQNKRKNGAQPYPFWILTLGIQNSESQNPEWIRLRPVLSFILASGFWLLTPAFHHNILCHSKTLEDIASLLWRADRCEHSGSRCRSLRDA